MNFSRLRLPIWLHTLLVAALLWAPLWGHLHNIGHGIEQGMAPSTWQALSVSAGLHQAHAPDGHVHGEHRHKGHSDDLGHEVDADLCRVLDHLSQAERLSAPCTPSLAPMVAKESPIFRVAFSTDQELWSPAQARAPPVLI